MLVLAMEFSRGAQRGHRASIIKEQTDERVRYARASGRRSTQKGGAGVASEGRNRPGLLEEQEPRVTPSKRNSDGPLPHPGPTGLTDGISEEMRSARGGMGMTANSQ
jgi:hypothetical protein